MGMEIARIMTPGALEKVMEWSPGTVDPIGFLILSECAQGVKVKDIASGLGIEIEDLESLAETIAGQGGTESQNWKNAVMILKASVVMNQQTITGGWDGIEAMAVQRLGQFMNAQGSNLSVKDALEIAQVANKANRRHLGEGVRGGTNITVRQGGGGNSDLDMELRSGNLGSIRMSLSQRVQAQLATPRTIDQETRESNREMLSLTDTRNLVDAKPS